jgi:hypothetical protein
MQINLLLQEHSTHLLVRHPVRNDNAWANNHPGNQSPRKAKEQYMLLKKIGLMAAVAATLITGGTAAAYAEGDAGIGDAAREFSTSAGLERQYAQTHGGYRYFPGSYAAAPGYDSTNGYSSYGYSRPVRSHRHIDR